MSKNKGPKGLPRHEWVKLDDELGWLRRRGTPKIVDTVGINFETNKAVEMENNFYALLLLFLPWRNEAVDLSLEHLGCSSYQEAFERKKADFAPMEKFYNGYKEVLRLSHAAELIRKEGWSLFFLYSQLHHTTSTSVC